MKSDLKNHEAVYTLQLDEAAIEMNGLLDKSIKLEFLNKINCINCGKETKKSFGQGFCYNCFISAPEADECILRPDRCRAHLGISRNMKWSQEHCLQPHIVYLAVSGGLKVGVTRLSQVPVRWIDQGATDAIRVCQVPNRHIAGVVEAFLMKNFSDKTNWKKMVTNEAFPEIDLHAGKATIAHLLPLELKRYLLSDDEQIFRIKYPVIEWPEKPVQVNLDKNSIVEGVLKGIRGQYLFFNNQQVLNVRRFSGYKVKIVL
jgi:hypothetical protein